MAAWFTLLIISFCNLGLALPAITLFIVTFVGYDRLATVALFTFGVGMSGGKYSAYLSNHIDIAPNFAGKYNSVDSLWTRVRHDEFRFVVICCRHVTGNSKLFRNNSRLVSTSHCCVDHERRGKLSETYCRLVD